MWCADLLVNRQRPCLHRSALIYLTCSAHSGGGLSTQMISFLQCRRKGQTRGERERCGKKKEDKNQVGITKMDKIWNIFFSRTRWQSTGIMNTAHVTTWNWIILFTTEQQWSSWQCACIFLEKSNIHKVKGKFTAILFFFFGQWHPGAYHGCLLACLRSDLLLRVCCLQQGPAHPFPELTLSGSLFMWSQSLPSVTSHQLDQ